MNDIDNDVVCSKPFYRSYNNHFKKNNIQSSIEV